MSNPFPILYKQTSTGAIQTWSIEVDGNKYRTKSGQLNGAITVASWTTCKGKNTGKANETSAEGQALADATAKHRLQITNKHYTPDQSKAESGHRAFLVPMTAEKFKERKGKIKWGKEPVYVQLKFNGVRCLISKERLQSRRGKDYVSCPHIAWCLTSFFEKYPDIVLDGELFNENLRQNLPKICSLVRKEDPTPEEIRESKELVRFNVYDVCGTIEGKDIGSLSYKERNDLLRGWFGGFDNPGYIYIDSVKTTKVTSEAEVDKLLLEAEEVGHEGVMVRLEGPYQHKKSKFLLKYKSFIDKEFEIIGYAEGDGKFEGKLATLKFKAENGNEFDASVNGDFEFITQLWKDRDSLIGSIATVKYVELTPVKEDTGEGGVPQFGKVVALRNYE